MRVRAKQPASSIELVDEGFWTQSEPGPRLENYSRLDPALRSVFALIDSEDWDQLYRRTGIQWDPEKKNEPQYVPLLVEFEWRDISSVSAAREWLSTVNLEVAEAFFHEGEKECLPRFATARFAVQADNPGWLFAKSAQKTLVRSQIAAILNDKDGHIARIELPGAAQAFNEGALADIGLSAGARVRRNLQEPIDGKGVVIGIIDDGCAFAHPNFHSVDSAGPRLTSRLLYLWDQGRTNAAAPWHAVNGYLLGGFELRQKDIDTALNQYGDATNGVVDEDKIYRHFDHHIADLASHGTHVMDIAAGNGRAPMSTEGVAPKADLIFVQLPSPAITNGGATLEAAIAEGIDYIFKRAGNRRVVINISYGGYCGPHDGTSIIEQLIDAQLAMQPNRSVVVAAGNGFEADCHACGILSKGRKSSRILHWVLKPEDPTANVLELWYDATATLDLTLTTPDGTKLGPAGLNAGPKLLVSQGRLLGTLDHQQGFAPGSNRIRIALHPTGSAGASSTAVLTPAGTWQVHLSVSQGKARYDAWIERDVTSHPGGARRTQSHFAPDDAETSGTLAGYATGHLSIAVGAYNSATGQVCRYSACGPTRDKRKKPDVLAPAEEDAAGRGVLSASSRSAQPSRMNGTSASAPQVTGVVALLLQVARDEFKSLTAAQIVEKVCQGAKNAKSPLKPLRPNAHVNADKLRKVKQSAVWPDLTGNGRLNWPESDKLI